MCMTLLVQEHEFNSTVLSNVYMHGRIQRICMYMQIDTVQNL